MKVLWIVPYPVGDMAKALEIDEINAGSWIQATKNELLEHEDVELSMLSTIECKDSKSIYIDEVGYYILNLGHAMSYRSGNEENLCAWGNIIDELNPDIIQIWGTEFNYTQDIISISNKRPIVIYIQGVVSQIYEHYYGGLSIHEMLKKGTIFDYTKSLLLQKNRFDFKKQMKNERHVLNEITELIIDNKWCENQYRYKNELNMNYHILPIKREFFNSEWNEIDSTTINIFTVAGHYPLKGLHQLIKALSIVKEKYKNIKVLIPGSNNLQRDTFKSRIRRSTYLSYLKRLIQQYDLNENVRFLGSLSTDQMIENMMQSSVFVMPSCIENHSSSLREAMLLGMPCISSYVGSVPEFVVNGENGLLYRYEDYNGLASNIIEVLDDVDLCKKISKNASKTIREMLLKTNNIFQTYQEILERNTGG